MKNCRTASTFTGALLRHLLVWTALLSLPAASAAAQSATDGSTPSALTPGSPAGSYALSDLDTVSLHNGGVNFRLPLLNVGGRGGAGYPITLQIQKKWRVEKHKEPGVGSFYYPEPDWWSEDDYGWRVFDVGRLQIRRGHSEQFDLRCGGYVWRETLTRVTFTAPDGTEYEMRDQKTDGQYLFPPCDPNGGYNRGKVFVTSDGTSATFISDDDVRDAYKTDEIYDDRPSGYMLLKDGTRFRVHEGTIKWMRDRNGNQATFTFDSFKRVTGVTDSLGREVTIVYPSGSINYTEISFRGFGGRQRTLRVGESNLGGALRSGYSLQSETGPGGLFPELDASGGVNGNQMVVSYVELPDGRRYEFQYNSYAELARVVLPTGGAVEYDYAAGLANTYSSGVFNVTGPNNTISNKFIYRRVIERRVYPDGGTGTAYASKMTYGRPETLTTNSGYVLTEQCTPTPGETVGQCGTSTALLSRENHYFYGSPRASFSQPPTQYGSWKEGKEYRVETYHPQTNVLLRVVDNTWQQPLAGATWPLGTAETSDAAKPNIPQLTQTLTTLENGQASKQTFAYDRYSNHTDVYEYDYGTTTGVASHWARRISTTYVTTNVVGATTHDYACDPATTCSNTNITKDAIHQRSLPARKSVYNAAGVELSRVTYEYDDYDASDDPVPTESKHAPLEPRTNIIGLCTTYDALGVCANAAPDSFKTRGNVTAVTSHLLTGGAVTGSLSSFSQYDVAGNVIKSIDPRGKSSTVTYADSFCNDGVRCGYTYNPNTYAFAASNSSPVPDPSGQYGSTSPLVRTTVYDFWTGLPYSTTDTNNQTTYFEYEDDVNQLDRIKASVRPDGGRTEFNYGDMVGNLYLQTFTDLEGTRKIESKQYYDGLGRVYRTATYENAVAAEPWVNVDTEYDALGRVIKASLPFRSNRGGLPLTPQEWSGLSRTETEYDALRRVSKMTTRPDGAVAQTDYRGPRVLVTDQAGRQQLTRTDAFGRLAEVWEVTPNDAAKYPGVVSIPSAASEGLLSSGYGYRTEYFYDALDKLRGVKQDTQQRFFAYDSLGRLTRVKHPEQGNFTPDAAGGDFPALQDPVTNNQDWSTGYLYDANGNVLKRKDARGVVTTYGFDALNRNTTVVYTIPAGNDVAATADVFRYYDNGATGDYGKGRPHHVQQSGTTTSATYFDKYDAMGRPLVLRQKFKTNGAWSDDYAVRLEYNKAGGITRLTYPSDRKVEYQYDRMGRLGDYGGQPAFKGTLGDEAERTYASQVLYDELGGMSQERFGTDTPVYNKHFYNVRGQLTDIRVSTHPITSTDPNLKTNWNRGAILNHYSQAVWGGSDQYNNGNLQTQQVWIPADDSISGWSLFEQKYAYDALNRLRSVTEVGRWRQEYDYDRWGNRTINAAATQVFDPHATYAIPEPQFTVDPATNRLGVPAAQGGQMGYDPAGNLINDTYQGGQGGGGTRAYDAENRMTSAQFLAGQTQTAAYAYDADGRRVKRMVGTSSEVWQVYGAGGELLAEYAPNGSPAAPRKEYGYRGGELLVTAAPGAGQQRVNVALASAGATATSSSSYNSPPWVFPAAGAIDGEHKGANWSSGGGWNDATANTYPDWLQVSFNGAKTIDEVDVYTVQDAISSPSEPTEAMTFSLYGLTSYDVQYWTGSQWAAVPGGSVTGNNKVWRKFTFAPVTTDKIRVVVNAALDNYSRVVEVEAYQAQRTNHAASANGGVTSASSTYSAAFPVVSVNNGERRGVGWNGGQGGWNDATADAYPDWVEVSLAGAKAIDEVGVLTAQDAITSPSEPTGEMTFALYGLTGYEVQYWTGTAWATVPGGGVTNNNKVWRKVTFPAVVTTKVRVLINASLASYSRLVEVEAWGPGGVGSAGVDLRWVVSDHLGTPRMVLDKTGSLTSPDGQSGMTRHDYLPFGEELLAGMGGRAAGYGGGDTVRQKFTGYERDEETKLGYAQARYYADVQGRFTGVDPLLASGRVGSPQTWNRYSYALNNPLKYTDPTGMDVTLEGAQIADAVTSVNNRSGAKFKVTTDKDKKVRIVDDKGNVMGKQALTKLGATLSDGEKELFNAITDDKNHAFINTGDGKPNDKVDFGGNDSLTGGARNRNTLDMSEMKLLDTPENKGGLNSGDAIAHETLEAYAMAKDPKLDWSGAHDYAAKNFGEFAFGGMGYDPQSYSRDTGKYTSGAIGYYEIKPNRSYVKAVATVQFTNGYAPGAQSAPYRITKIQVVP